MIKFNVLLLCIFFILGCQSTRYDENAPHGCPEAWSTILNKEGAKELGVLVKNDCAILYKEEWKQSVNGHKGIRRPEICAPAWNDIHSKNLHVQARHLITNDCPILYSKEFINSSSK